MLDCVSVIKCPSGSLIVISIAFQGCCVIGTTTTWGDILVARLSRFSNRTFKKLEFPTTKIEDLYLIKFHTYYLDFRFNKCIISFSLTSGAA